MAASNTHALSPHNGLTCAAYLAMAGKSVLVLEKRPVIGGAAVSEEIFPGFTYTVCSYVVSLLRSEVIRDLELKRHGFEMIRMDGALSVCGDDYLFLIGDEQHDVISVDYVTEPGLLDPGRVEPKPTGTGFGLAGGGLTDTVPGRGAADWDPAGDGRSEPLFISSRARFSMAGRCLGEPEPAGGRVPAAAGHRTC